MKKLNIRGIDTFFSPSFEKGVYIYSLIVSFIYLVFEFFNIRLFTGNNVISYLLYFFPPITSMVVSLVLLIKRNKNKHMFVWQVLSLAIFIAGHFFPFYYDISKPDFQVLNILYLLIGLLILYLPFIAAQFLLLLCFKKTTLLKEPEHVAPFIVHSKYLRQKYFLYIMLPIIVTIMAVISQNYIMFFVFFLTLFFGFSDMYYDSVRKIYLTEEDLLFYSANKVIILPFKDINRLSLQKGFINVKKVLGLNGFTDKAHNYFRFTINQQISGYKELIPAIINKCDHLDASFTAKLLKDFQEGNANQK